MGKGLLIGALAGQATENKSLCLPATLLRPRARACSSGRAAHVRVVIAVDVVGAPAATPKLCVRPAEQLCRLDVEPPSARVAGDAVVVVEREWLHDGCVLAVAREQCQRRVVS